jgi:hypothetical protein
VGHASQTHCQRGHEFTPENTYRQKAGRYRLCRSCTLYTNKKWDVMSRKVERRRKLENGWLHIDEARAMGYSDYPESRNHIRVLIWVVGYGVTTGYIHETPRGLRYFPHAGLMSDRFLGWQPCPGSPRAKKKTKHRREP